MKLGNDLLNKEFDKIEGKIDFLIELCQAFQVENSELNLKVKNLELELEKNKEPESLYLDQKAEIQIKIDGLLSKLDSFSKSPFSEETQTRD